MEKITVDKDKSRMELILRKPYEGADKAQISIRGLAPGEYRIRADGKERIIEGERQLTCSLKYKKEEIPVTIIKKRIEINL